MASGKHIPLRKCVGCQQMKPKSEMLRIIRTPEETIVPDFSGKQNGRGAYLCRDIQCLMRAEKNRGLSRTLKTSVDPSLIEELRQRMEGSL